jgi:hypothetical protein
VEQAAHPSKSTGFHIIAAATLSVITEFGLWVGTFRPVDSTGEKPSK